MAAWIFQANPKAYDIDAAVAELSEIWWRAPQHTAELRPGDPVAIWKSGKEAGVVAVGRLASEPQVVPMTPEEQRFIASESEDDDESTRVLVRLLRCDPVSKDRVGALADLSDHQIIRAPMGTVFALDDSQWAALAALLPEPPEVNQSESGTVPEPFSRAQRSKSVHPLPRGYDGYLTSLRTLLVAIVDQRPAVNDFPQVVKELYSVTDNRSYLMTSFLKKITVVVESGGVAVPSDWASKWRDTGRDEIIIGLLHSRVRFVGEMLAETRQPRTVSQLLEIANVLYEMSWNTQAQIARRRGWLQSAGYLIVDENQRLSITPAGEAFLSLTAVEPPTNRRATQEAVRPVVNDPLPPPVVAIDAGSTTDELKELIQELGDASTDSSNPNRFEQAVTRAFTFLGFEAAWLGGAGKTDVMLDAQLAGSESYRVIVDCKTSGSGSVSDQQIDWITLKEHRAKHNADYVAVVAPNPSGSRLFERAADNRVTIISSDQLSELCRQHSAAPLGFVSYRKVFECDGVLDAEVISEDAEEWLRVSNLARTVLEIARDQAPKFGRLTARDLFLILASGSDDEAITVDDVDSVLVAMSSPLVGLVEGDPVGGYVVTASPRVVARRLKSLGDQLGESAGPP
jgi:hypothetical protein